MTNEKFAFPAALLKGLSPKNCPQRIQGTVPKEFPQKRKFPTIQQPIGILAETAISTLLERIKKPSLPPRQILVNATKIS